MSCCYNQRTKFPKYCCRISRLYLLHDGTCTILGSQEVPAPYSRLCIACVSADGEHSGFTHRSLNCCSYHRGNASTRPIPTGVNFRRVELDQLVASQEQHCCLPQPDTLIQAVLAVAVYFSLIVRMQQLVLNLVFSALLLFAAMPSVYLQSDCSQAESCDLCVGDSMLNLTGCVWRLCPDGNDAGACVTDDGDPIDKSRNCSWTRVSELCTVVETVAVGGAEGEAGDGGKTNSSPEFSQAKFDMSSFIGGIILVLCVQAGGLLAMRFLKSKEQSNYDPIDQPQ
ncbi:uncharacterized protein cd164l2 isoform X1 [Takifugu flavidus]|nr:uncharacterized protein cd164l2 isoform X1 [Takifugu flavidus]